MKAGGKSGGGGGGGAVSEGGGDVQWMGGLMNAHHNALIIMKGMKVR